MSELSAERITIDEAIRRGYVFGPLGYDYATARTLIARLTTIQWLSSGGLIDVAILERIREDQLEPEPAGDIPMER